MPDYKSEGRQSCTLADIDWKVKLCSTTSRPSESSGASAFSSRETASERMSSRNPRHVGSPKVFFIEWEDRVRAWTLGPFHGAKITLKSTTSTARERARRRTLHRSCSYDSFSRRRKERSSRTDQQSFPLQLHRVLSSDKIADSDTSLVRVQLQIEESSSSNTRQISLELTRNELENVLSKLDNAKKAFDQLSEQKEQ